MDRPLFPAPMTAPSAQRLAAWLIAGVSVAYPTLGLVYLGFGSLPIASVAVVSLAAVGVPHLLTMRAALRGRRPHPLPLLAQALATYVPDLLLPGGLSGVTAQLLACGLLVSLPLRLAGPAVAAMTAWQAVLLFAVLPGPVIPFFYAATIPVTGAMVVVVVRLAAVTRELDGARAELAEAAVLKERLRISRDLHDGLGHSLTAIALKGDLAARLLPGDPATARGEVGELVRVAREAAQDVRQVVHGYRRRSLRAEIDRAVSLLEVSGIGCQTHLAGEPAEGGASEAALAWAVREGVTNVLRHSRATTCTITTAVQGRGLRLEIVNDGVPGERAQPGPGLPGHTGSGPTASSPAAPGLAAPGPAASGLPGSRLAGSGLAGLRERAEQVGGSMSAGPAGAAGFRLTVEVPA
ncbi:sensor histidine kinase [Nonomuraea longicatena]|uniref:Signal transduction histidine kinase subgroup 3 dimerisation and phosphoacceptor domain-containing protein n=1 Tax=Nonomuraea longicatena TaxID=83682 RepID=A0ABP4BAF5_9ACTN